MVLLHALAVLAGKFKWQLCVAHFNHQLRGRSSQADEKLVRITAAELKLPVVVGRADVRSLARKSKLSIEMAARKLRHEFLARAAQERKISLVALAHHADDQVELFFLRLLRGAGGVGLAGMKWRSVSPVAKNITLVRPLLEFSKAEIVAFARAEKIPFREDASNSDADILRNRIRHELLPLLKKHYSPGLEKTVLRLMEIVGTESELVGQLAEAWGRRPSAGFEALPVAVQRRVLQTQLVGLGLTGDFDLIEALRKTAGTGISVSRDASVSRTVDGKVTLNPHSRAGFGIGELAVELAGRAGEARFKAARINWRLDARKVFQRRAGETNCEFFDADQVGQKIILRHWQPGDRFQPIGLKSAAKLQDLLTNAKIPSARRHQLIVAVAGGGEIFWVEGLRISEKFKLTGKTKRRLAWRW